MHGRCFCFFVVNVYFVVCRGMLVLFYGKKGNIASIPIFTPLIPIITFVWSGNIIAGLRQNDVG